VAENPEGGQGDRWFGCVRRGERSETCRRGADRRQARWGCPEFSPTPAASAGKEVTARAGTARSRRV